MTEEASLIMASWSWLVEADYIDANVQDDIGLKEAVLSAKGISILKSMAMPYTLTLGYRLTTAIDEGDLCINNEFYYFAAWFLCCLLATQVSKTEQYPMKVKML